MNYFKHNKIFNIKLRFLAILHLQQFNQLYTIVFMDILWYIFIIVAISGFILDILAIKHEHINHNHKISAYILFAWILIAILFGGIIFLSRGHDDALKYFTGYIIELSLSVDNLFVFMSIFAYFHIHGDAQQKALTYGIIGAVIMRLGFIFAGIAVLEHFHWLMYVFGLMLILSGIKMFNKKETTASHGTFLKTIEKSFHVRRSSNELSFFTKYNNKWYVTPLLVCVIAIECADIMFAADSVPAVLSVSQDRLIVFSSNVFAIVGLRALYVYVNHLASKFSMLKYGIAANLIFVGIKMLCTQIAPISTITSIIVISSTLLISIIMSLIVNKQKENIHNNHQ